VRSVIAGDYAAAFGKCDFIITPVAPTAAFRIGEKVDNPLAMYLGDIYSVVANLVGVPAISIPCGVTNSRLPIGIQISANHLDEGRMLGAAARLEALLAADGAWPVARKAS
jgi:aspartyl-tRNA(Asn)/glutamyl-tRNA(Gln) amidotransferase subunit A